MIFITFWTNFQFGPRLWVAVCSCKANVTEFDPQEVHQLFSFQDRCQWVRFPYGPPSLECVQQQTKKNNQNLFDTRSFDFPVKKVEAHSVSLGWILQQV